MRNKFLKSKLLLQMGATTAPFLLFLLQNQTGARPHAENEKAKGAVSKWLKQAMRGSAFFRNIFGQAKTECRKNGTQGIIFIRNSKWNEL